MPNQKIIAVFNKAPYERVSVVEGARCIAGVVAMGTEGIAVFIDDGVYALLKNQNPAGAGLESVSIFLKLLETNKVPINVIQESLRDRGIQESDLMELRGLEAISMKQFSEMILNYSSAFVM